MPDRLAVTLRQGMVLLLAVVSMFLQTVPSFAHATRADAEKAKVEKLGVGQHDACGVSPRTYIPLGAAPIWAR
jgi:hypothetical protein